jgi:feruloyl-CoA synthase
MKWGLKMLDLEFESTIIKLGNHDVVTELSATNEMILRHAEFLDLDDKTMLDGIDYWSIKAPNTVFLRERISDGWAEISYKEFALRVETIASHLGSLNLSQDKPLLIIAPNSINHAIVAHAAMTIGVPVTPVSVAYAQIGNTFERLSHIIDTLDPGAIYISDTSFFKRVVDTLVSNYDIPCIASHTHHDKVTAIKALPKIGELEVAKRRAMVTQDTIAKVMMTSGSTGVPKGVINTHRMIYSNQVALYKMWPFLQSMVPNLVDWLPWSHTFGGNVCFNITLFNGGTLTIDDGKPIPGQIGRTVENICLIQPNIHFNVPIGIEALVTQFEDNPAIAKKFFSSVKVIFVAAAALPDKTRNRLKEMAIQLVGESPKLLAGWGSTETAPFATCLNFESDLSVNIGVPMPGTEIKLTPTQNKLELSVRGPNVTPGYWRNPEATSKAFDIDGFYAMGDAGSLIDLKCPSKGLIFEGRISENFKLKSGTWVNVNQVRVAVNTVLKPLCVDSVVTGHDMSDIGLLLIPNFSRLAEQYELNEEQQVSVYLQTVDDFINEIKERLRAYNEEHYSNSTRIRRFALLPLVPSMEKNEMTDKGYLNQRALLENWSNLIDSMHEKNHSESLTFHTF